MVGEGGRLGRGRGMMMEGGGDSQCREMDGRSEWLQRMIEVCRKVGTDWGRRVVELSGG